MDFEVPPDMSRLPPKFGDNQHIDIDDATWQQLKAVVDSIHHKAPIRYAFAYGSGVFAQKGYDSKVTTSLIQAHRRNDGTGQEDSESYRTMEHHSAILTSYSQDEQDTCIPICSHAAEGFFFFFYSTNQKICGVKVCPREGRIEGIGLVDSLLTWIHVVMLSNRKSQWSTLSLESRIHSTGTRSIYRRTHITTHSWASLAARPWP